MPARTKPQLIIEWEPDPEVFSQAVMSVENALQHTEIPLMLASRQVREDIHQRFETHTGPDGEKWDEWSDKYEPIALSYPNIDLLRQDDELYEHVTGAEAWTVSHDTLFFDANMPSYGRAHQEGLPLRKTKGGSPNPLPRRAFLGMSNESRVFVDAIFVEWFNEAVQLYETTLGRMGTRHQLRGAGGRFVPRSEPLPVRP